jgi:hypothetical protein
MKLNWQAGSNVDASSIAMRESYVRRYNLAGPKGLVPDLGIYSRFRVEGWES